MESSGSRSEHLKARAVALVALFRAQLPLEFPALGVDDSWPLVGPALLARQAGTVEAIVELATLERRADALVLVRSLFDHAATFAWLAANPGAEGQRRFLKTDSAKRIRADDDCRALGVPILDDQMRRVCETQAAIPERNMPDLIGLVTRADAYWTGQLPGLRGADHTHSYRGLYAIVYRHYSAYEHASVLGLNPVTVDLPGGGKRVVLEPPVSPTDHLPLQTANVLFGFSLGIAVLAFGWPERGDIDAVFAGHPE